MLLIFYCSWWVPNHNAGKSRYHVNAPQLLFWPQCSNISILQVSNIWRWFWWCSWYGSSRRLFVLWSCCSHVFEERSFMQYWHTIEMGCKSTDEGRRRVSSKIFVYKTVESPYKYINCSDIWQVSNDWWPVIWRTTDYQSMTCYLFWLAPLATPQPKGCLQQCATCFFDDCN